MIQKIIQVSDIHIHNYRRIGEYQDRLTDFINECKTIVNDIGQDGVRIVVCGDLVNSHNEVSNEAYVLAGWFLRELDNICKTIVIAGNHDKTSNQDRTDTLTAIFLNNNFKQTYYLDKELGYESGCVVDDNVVWCLYSAFDGFEKPNIEDYRSEYPSNTFIGLFHGDLVSAKTDVGFVTTTGENVNLFDGVDFGLFGHIHKFQCIKNDGIPLVYSGSLIQQNFGENVSGHGYVVWDVNSREYEFKEIYNRENNYYVISINSITDLDHNWEEFINL